MTEKTKQTPKELLQAASRLLMHEFQEIRESNPHAGEQGQETEGILKTFLNQRLPRRFQAESGFVLASEGNISAQTDVIVYDALHSPLWRAGARSHIIPRDNTAAVIEVKAKLNKRELEEAALKLAHIKGMRASPTPRSMQADDLVLEKPFSCVFAFDSYTSLDTLAANLEEINRGIDSRHWLDMVVDLSKGTLAFAVQLPSAKGMSGTYGGHASDSVVAPPMYVHLIKKDGAELALNSFFIQLISHLTLFRQLTTIDYDEILGPDPGVITAISAYQHRLDGTLAPVEATHLNETFQTPRPRFMVYGRSDKLLLGQVCYWKWQDGAVITCSIRGNHLAIFEQYFAALKVKGFVMKHGGEQNLFLSNVLPISEERFEAITKRLSGDFFVIKDDDGNAPPAARFEGKPPPRRT